MFVTIRRYTPKDEGAMTTDATEKLRRQLQDTFLPLAQKIGGFHGYYAVNLDNRELVTISLYETREGASESNRRAADFTKQSPLPFEVGRPDVLEGEVIVHGDASRMAGAR